MVAKSVLDILKEAILLENQGRVFYENVADQAANPEVRRIFETMAAEESKHARILEAQAARYIENGSIHPVASGENTSALISGVLSNEVRANILKAEFEASAINAALAMEERSIRVYRELQEQLEDSEAKDLCTWLANWEQEHLSFLLDIDQQLREQVWNDQHFWPF